MEYDLFLMPFLTSFVVAGLLLFFLVKIARKKKFTDTSGGVSRFGGVALIISFTAAVLWDRNLVVTMPLAGVLIAAASILVFGVVDDLKQLGWKSQLIFQLSIVLFVCLAGVRLQYVSGPLGEPFFFEDGFAYFLGLLVSMIWVTFLMNVMNLVDGVDGVSGGISLIATGVIFILSQFPEVNQPPIGIITAAMSGGLAVFLLYNFFPARIIAGTSGSMFMGFILAILAIFAGAKIATTLMVLAVPIIDALWVMGERVRSKKSIFIGDRRHLHYRLLELGWSAKKICLFYYGITATIAALALNMRAIGKIATLVAVSIILVLILAVISKKAGHMSEIMDKS